MSKIASALSVCEEVLVSFNGGSSRLAYDIVTGDKTRIYGCNLQIKCKSTAWIFHNEDPSTNVKRPRSVGKRIAATKKCLCRECFSCGSKEKRRKPLTGVTQQRASSRFPAGTALRLRDRRGSCCTMTLSLRTHTQCHA